jgi:predicted heme/steroid binding protein
LIPVVAHNWGGVIRARGQDVVAWAPMGSMVRCHNNSFEQVNAMRRTSQWVVPLMVVGGAGIGYGIGYAMDRSQERRVEETKVQIGAAGASSALIIFDGRFYDVSRAATSGDGASAANPLGRDALVAAMQRGQPQLQGMLDRASENIGNCAARMFQELVSSNVGGVQKFGDVRIASSGCNCGTSNDNLIHCSGSTGNMASLAHTRPCPQNRNMSGFPTNGTCYFRTGFGPVSGSPDRTAAYDLHRARLIENYINHHRPDLRGRLNITPNTSTDAARLNSLQICMASGTFNDISTALGQSAGNCPQSFFAANGPAESLAEWMGAHRALQEVGANLTAQNNTLTTELFDKINNTFELMVDTETAVTGMDILDTQFGKDRPWLQTARGRGTLIGAGVGVLAGLGYWFAEGRSVFCNVGGIGNIRMNNTFSIPTFREYIIRHNYMTPADMNIPRP